MDRKTLLAIAAVAAALGVGLFFYGQWLRIIQTSSPLTERWAPVLLLVALLSCVAALFRR